MPHILPWTQPMDARLQRLRREGAPWRAIAAELRLSPLAVRARGRRLGLADWSPADVPGAPPAREDLHRPPLPAGDARAWDILTQGTVLEGTDATAIVDAAI
jgi:hypothetical protein